MNNLKDRILDLMKVQNLTQRQFAEMIHISPASLSSIVNNRSNPTFKHVEAILKNIPHVNSRWLTLGEGEMFLPQAQMGDNIAAEGDSESLEGTLFANPSIPSPTPQEVATVEQPPVQAEKKAAAPIIKEVKVVETKIRKITEIRVFYEDQTWETFVPQK